ncbi:hypothetical protein HpVa125_07030 [Helicobacter pylori]
MQTTWKNQHQSFERWHYALAGQALIPIPVVGALIEGFVDTTMSKTFYDILLKTLKEAKEAHQKRIKAEKECRESIRLLEMHQNQFNEVFERYFHGTIKFFNESFDELEMVLYAGDADLVIGANNKIQEGLGQKALFGNKQECWEFHHQPWKNRNLKEKSWKKIEMGMRLCLM